MLLSTLVPTALHFILLLASPIALVALPTEKRLTMADDLETYDDQPKRQPSIRRQAAQYVARERHGTLALATFIFIFIILIAVLSIVFRLLHKGGLAGYVLEVARVGIKTARWLVGLF